MKKISKTISVLLAVLMLFTCVPVSNAGSRVFTETKSSVPVIMMCGQGAGIWSADGRQLYPVTVPDNYIGQAFDECLPLFTEALKSGDYSDWSDALVPYFENLYSELRLNPDGSVPAGQHIMENNGGEYGPDHYYANGAQHAGRYELEDFSFSMDWRQDPYEVAEQFRAHVQLVKDATGSDKVAVIARCEAAAILAVYLKLYGSDDFESIVLHVATLGGCEAVSGIFSGNFTLEADSLQDFLNGGSNDFFEVNIEDPAIMELINSTLGFLDEVYGLEIACAMLRPLISKLYDEAVFECLRVSYGSFPGIWTLVRPEDFEKTRDGMFAGVEEEYAGLIERLNRYHYEVGLHYKEIFAEAAANGVKTAVVSKYTDGCALFPCCENNKLLNDGVVGLTNSSLGAATAYTDKLITAYYLMNAEQNGTAKYISPDRRVDASTCLFPDTTWFIYGLDHKTFSNQSFELIMQFCALHGEMDINSDEKYPQYLTSLQNGEIVPMTAENGMPAPEGSNSPAAKRNSFLNKLLSFLKVIFSFIFKIFDKEA